MGLICSNSALPTNLLAMLASTGSCSTGVVPGSSEFKNTTAVEDLQSGESLICQCMLPWGNKVPLP